jgi:hypothetical protein
MKSMILALAAVATLQVATAAQARPGDPTNWRETSQEQRIDRGARRGDLTRGEANRLRNREHRIDRMDRRAWADGRFTARERWRMHRAFNRQSRRIWRYRHNHAGRC